MKTTFRGNQSLHTSGLNKAVLECVNSAHNIDQFLTLALRSERRSYRTVRNSDNSFLLHAKLHPEFYSRNYVERNSSGARKSLEDGERMSSNSAGRAVTEKPNVMVFHKPKAMYNSKPTANELYFNAKGKLYRYQESQSTLCDEDLIVNEKALQDISSLVKSQTPISHKTNKKCKQFSITKTNLCTEIILKGPRTIEEIEFYPSNASIEPDSASQKVNCFKENEGTKSDHSISSSSRSITEKCIIEESPHCSEFEYQQSCCRTNLEPEKRKRLCTGECHNVDIDNYNPKQQNRLSIHHKQHLECHHACSFQQLRLPFICSHHENLSSSWSPNHCCRDNNAFTEGKTICSFRELEGNEM